jgi:hypothetical protein
MQRRNKRFFIKTGGYFSQPEIIRRHLDGAHLQGKIKGNRLVKEKFFGIPGKDVLSEIIYAHLSENADPGKFLEFAYREIPESLSDETENMTARRLIDLGFPERATQFLTGAAVREAAAERRYLRAEAALASGRFIDVIDLLIGLSDDRASQLRSDAYAALGEYRTALSEAGGNGSLDDTTLQFRAQAWERLAIEEDPALSSFAEVILASPPSEAAVTLADRRELLTNSQESRRAVEELLTRFDGEISEE